MVQSLILLSGLFPLLIGTGFAVGAYSYHALGVSERSAYMLGCSMPLTLLILAGVTLH